MQRGMSRAPAWVLFFLAPCVGELLSSSAPPVEFFNPMVFLVLCILYGGGAIIVRELTLRWRKGWPTLFTLGAAYGVVEEGLMVRSFFNPNWVDIGVLGSYGRWWGVNWQWSLGLTIYHAVISIAVPILLVGLVFPHQRSQPWVGPKTFILLSVLLAVDVAFSWLLIRYTPPLGPYLGTVGLVMLLFLVARRMPTVDAASCNVSKPPRPAWFYAVGFLSTVAFYVLMFGTPHLKIPAPLALLLLATFVAAVAALLYRKSGSGLEWQLRHKLALACGLLSLFILLAPLREFGEAQPDNTAGMTVVAGTAVLLMIWLGRRIKRVPKTNVATNPSRENYPLPNTNL